MAKVRYVGDDKETTIREVTFKKGRAKTVSDPDLFAKVVALPYFETVDDDENIE